MHFNRLQMNYKSEIYLQVQELTFLEQMEDNWLKKVTYLRNNVDKVEEYKKDMENYPKIKKTRDDLLNRIEKIAKERVDSSKGDILDLNAYYCLYLIDKFKEAEERNEKLRDELIDVKYGDDSQQIQEAIKFEIPDDLATMNKNYENYLNDLKRLEMNLQISHSVIETIRKSITDARNRFKESEKLIPDDYREKIMQINQVKNQYDTQLELFRKESIRVNERKNKLQNRLKLIDEVIDKLDPKKLQLPPGTYMEKRIQHLRFTLSNINSNNQSEQLVVKSINSFLKSGKRKNIQNIKENIVFHTPNSKRIPILPLSPKPTLDDIQQEMNQVKMLLNEVSIRNSPVGKKVSVEEFKKQINELQSYQRKTPSSISKPISKSST